MFFFEVNESFISDQIDFYYRSLSDLSVPYTVYVAANERKPLVTHNFGALPILIKKERLGFIIDTDEKENQIKFSDYVASWSPKGAAQFLEDRTWEIAATRLIRAIEE
jgi:topoisomerase IA-like protein